MYTSTSRTQSITTKDICNKQGKKSKLRKEKNNTTEIKQEDNAPMDDDNLDYYPQPGLEKTNSTFVYIFNLQGLVATDLIGTFPITSSLGFRYILLWYNYNSNTFHSIPLKSKTSKEQTEAYNIAYEFHLRKGFIPKVHKMDNGASNKFKLNLDDKKIKYQLVPPHMHCQNPAKRAIRTWKQNFLSAAATFDPTFLIILWCRILEAMDLQQNLLRGSCLHPQLSGECHLNREFDFMVTPMAPLGSKSTIFVPIGNHLTWEFHYLEGY